MRRTRLSWLLTLVWFAFGGLAVAAAMTYPPGPILYAVLAVSALVPSLAGWFIARRADRQERKALSALGEATGIAPMSGHDALGYSREIIANLCARLERARHYQSAFELSGQPMLIADENGTIIKMSAGIASRAPECAETETIAALFGSDVPRRETALKGRARFANYDWQAISTPVGQGRWLVALERPGVIIGEGHFHAMTEALMGGETRFRFSEEVLAGNPDLEAINSGFEALDQSVEALEALARDGEAAEIVPSNGGLSPQVMALSQTIAELAHARDQEAEARQQTRARLEKVGALVELCRKSAGDLTAAAEAARLATDGAREAFEAGEKAAQGIAEAKIGLSGRSDAAGEAARRASESVVAVEALAREIDQLVSGIEDVSFRTNLLALNAAVEAARAGEKGAGFAVVAAEVRELAQSSTKASKTIRQLVSKSLAQAGTGSAQAQALLSALSDIDAHLLNLSDEAARMEGTLADGSKALSEVQSEANVLVMKAQAQADALAGERDDNRLPEGGHARRV